MHADNLHWALHIHISGVTLTHFKVTEEFENGGVFSDLNVSWLSIFALDCLKC